MKKAIISLVIVVALLAALVAAAVSGVRFGFASNPDDPNETDTAEPIDTSVDTFEYDPSLEGTKITLLNSKAEIQNALVAMSEEFEKKSGVHVEVMPVTDATRPTPRWSACTTRAIRPRCPSWTPPTSSLWLRPRRPTCPTSPGWPRLRAM